MEKERVKFTRKDGTPVEFRAKKKRRKGVLPAKSSVGERVTARRGGREITWERKPSRWEIVGTGEGIDYDNFVKECKVQKEDISRQTFENISIAYSDSEICKIYKEEGRDGIEALNRRSSRSVLEESVPSKKFLFKTLIDTLITALIAIGIFQSPTFLIETMYGYIGLILLLSAIVTLMVIYAELHGTRANMIGILVVVIISFFEVLLIGFLLGAEIQLIIVVFLIVIPSVVIFDRILG